MAVEWGRMKEGKYNRDIDVLRGMAIMLVVSYHMAAVAFIPEALKSFLALFNGSFGVDLFFVISGFLVSSSLSRALNAGLQDNFSVLRVYFARRWFRTIVPAVVWVVFWTGLSYLTPWFGDFSKNAHHALAAIFQWAHIFLYVECVKADGCGIFGYYWSLSLEEWFYLLLPLFFIVVRGRALYALIGTMLVVLFYLAFQGWPMWGIFRIEPMLCGVLVYHFRVPLTGWACEIRRRWSSWLFVPLVILACMYATAHFFGKAYFFIVLGCVALLVLSLPDKGSLMPRRLAVIFARVGELSFSIYLVHIPLIWMVGYFYVGHAGAISMLVFNGVLFLLIGVFSVFSFRWLELPSRNLGYQLSSKLELRFSRV
ncbi:MULTISPECIES: acyltransferase family protein [Pseudomonas]|uniref:Acyltransferase n=1 Tax=Pseudomonas aphyarum TaxID=2942629 RepID=A0ABT5PHY8_9PSED|nr:acyltransferase [Pseudomonas aphyarum]MDD0970034.1 acyltransferase [Pseudomonas aphyarum]MDD1123440.1 acyltransferase [Pseudomonas aphyarum]